MAARRPTNLKISLHKAPLKFRQCRELLEILGVPREFQDQFIIKVTGGHTVRLKDAAEWVQFYLKQWRTHINRLRREFEARGDWPPKSIKAGFERLILSGLTNEEAHEILDPIFGSDGVRRKNQACYYRFILAKQGRLPPELCPERHPGKTGCKGGKRPVTK